MVRSYWGMQAVGFRFRRSVKILPGIRLNFSKSGISTSLGGRGASINIGPKGTRKTVGLPGTGLSYSTFSSHGSNANPGTELPPTAKLGASFGQGCGCVAIIVVLLAAIGTCSQKPEQPGDQALATRASGLSADGADSKSYKAGDAVYVSSNKLNARSSPTTSSRIVGKLHSGQLLRVVASQGGWLKVAQGAALFWIISSHVTGSVPNSNRAPQNLIAPSTKHSNATNHSRSRSKFGDNACPCSRSHICIGPRGGRYCITSDGKKRYGV